MHYPHSQRDFTRLGRLAALGVALMLAWGVSQAQTKLGSNPGTLANDVNLQVEATDGSQVVVRKSTAQLGVGTSSPGNRLEVNSSISGTSGVRLTQLPNAVLGTNASGDVVATTANKCTCGDIKASLNTLNHGDWYYMDGWAYSGPTCGTIGLDTRNRVLAQGGTLYQSSAATPIVLTRANMPEFTLSGTTLPYTHSHVGDGNSGPIGAGGIGLIRRTEVGENRTVGSVDTTWSGVQPDLTSAPRNIPSDTHSHTVSFIVNDVVTQGQPQAGITLGTQHLPRLQVNYFVCVH